MTRDYLQAVLGVPNSVRAEVVALRDDETKAGDLVREVLQSLHPERVCQGTLSGLVHHVYLITVDDDLDEGNLKRIKNKWPAIRVLAAFKQNGLQVGQSYDANGNVVGTPTVTMTGAQEAAIRANWPIEFIGMNGKLTPPNRVQGQTDWSF